MLNYNSQISNKLLKCKQLKLTSRFSPNYYKNCKGFVLQSFHCLWYVVNMLNQTPWMQKVQGQAEVRRVSQIISCTHLSVS